MTSTRFGFRIELLNFIWLEVTHQANLRPTHSTPSLSYHWSYLNPSIRKNGVGPYETRWQEEAQPIKPIKLKTFHPYPPFLRISIYSSRRVLIGFLHPRDPWKLFQILKWRWVWQSWRRYLWFQLSSSLRLLQGPKAWAMLWLFGPRLWP